MTGDEFCELAERLRALGAAKVKAGEMEVVFVPQPLLAKPVEPVAQPVRQAQQLKKILTPEEQLIAQFREEMGEA
jgi:hypothetical protein